MKLNKIATSFVFGIMVCDAFATGKTMDEWLRDAEIAMLELRDNDISADAAKTTGNKAMTDAARVGEAKALAQYQQGMVSACANAREMVSWLKEEGYLDDREGFERMMKVIDDAIKDVNAPRKPTSSFMADNIMKIVCIDALILSSGIEWLRENRGARDEARELRKDINTRLIPYLKEHKIPDSATMEYNRGMQAFADGKKSFSESSFDKAILQFSKAKKDLSSARSRTIVLADVPAPIDR